MQRKGLLILRGLTFRPKYNNDSFTNNILGYFAQIKATKSHKRFLKYISNKYNTRFDVALDTAVSGFEKDILKILSDYLKIVNVNYFYDPNQVFGLIRILSDLKKYINQYDFILILRNDIEIFKEFDHIFNPYENRVMFPFVHEYSCRKVYGYSKWPILSDTFIYIPSNYFNFLDVFNYVVPPIVHMHDIVHVAKEELKVDFDFGVYANTYHNTDTSGTWNPLYKICYKKHAKRKKDDGLRYPDHF